ncbi:MAG: hypothetical protein LCH88_05340 [Proteobacteria bacterium]|nr:hypothetical protein [Pseudomonadota bacterium]
MARTILGEVILRLRDLVTPGLRALSDRLKATDGDLRNFGKGGTGGRDVARSLKDAQAAATGAQREIQRARSAITALRAEAAAPIRIRIEHDRGFRGRIAADIAAARNAARQPIVVPAPVSHPTRPTGAAPLAAATLGAVTGPRIARGGRYAITQGAESSREDLRISNQGATPAEAADIEATARRLSAMPAYRSQDHVQIRELMRNLLANVGDYGKVNELAEPYLRGRVALQTILGPRADDREMEYFSRFIDLAGRSRDVGSTKALIDAYLRARQLDSRAVTAQDYVNFMQTGGSAARGFSDDFLAKVAPAIIAQQRGHRTGTDFMTAFQNFAMGRGTAATIEQQLDFFRGGSDSNLSQQDSLGLREGVQRDRRGRMTNRGRLVDEPLYLANPYEWAKKHLVPRLIQEGALPEAYGRGDFSQDISAEQRGTLNRRLNDLFSARRGSSLFSLMLGDMGQIEAFMERLQKARGAENVERDAARDPFVAFEGVMAQLRNSVADLSKPIVTAVLPALNAFAGSLNAISQWINKNPAIAPYASGGAALGVGAAGLAAGWLTLRGIGSALGLGGGGAAAGGGLLGGVARFLPGVGIGLSAIPALGFAGSQFADYFKGVGDGDVHNRGRSRRQEAERIQRAERDQRFGPMDGEHSTGGGFGSDGSGAFRSWGESARQAGEQAGAQIGQGVASGAQGATSAASAAGAAIGEAIARAARASAGSPAGPQPAAPDAPGRMSGGPVSAGQLYTVGEAGPELFSPGANGSIIPNHALRDSAEAAGGLSEGGRRGSSQTRNVTFRGPLIGAIHVTGGNASEIMDQIGDRVRTALEGTFADSNLSWG